MQTHEDFEHCPGEAFIQSEAVAGPVERRAHASQLGRDGAAGLLFPFPDLRNEGVSADFMAG